jgi:hypothetical protein
VPYNISAMSKSIPSNSARIFRTSSTDNTTGSNSGRLARSASIAGKSISRIF